MKSLKPGLYEQLLTQSLAEQLQTLHDDNVARTSPLDPAEAADRLALFFSNVLRRTIDSLSTNQRRQVGVEMVRNMIQQLARTYSSVDAGDLPEPTGDLLRSVLALQPDGKPQTLIEPATPLLDTSLLTNAPGEPRLLFQITSEIPSADGIDVLMAFVRRSGIRPLLPVLQRHIEAGRPLRILTTTYTGSTELAALDLLQELGADVRVSYDTSTTRLHAKAWLFHRHSGHSTGFIGSSNLTHSAQVSGLEWNVRVSAARNHDVIDKFQAVFDTYWNSGDFQPFDHDEFRTFTTTPDKGPADSITKCDVSGTQRELRAVS